jgi:hypothetical protein
VGLRETLNENPGLTTAATAIIILTALGFGLWQFMRGSGAGGSATSGGPARAYFTIDDGKTWFEDSLAKLPPFQHDGKTAYRARLFTCDGGKTKFVGYLERFTPEMRAHIESLQKGGPGTIPMESQESGGIEVKKPGTGDKGWVKRSDPTAQKLIEAVTCPDGSTNNLEMVPEP